MKTLIDNDTLVYSPPDPGCVLYQPSLPGGSNRIHDRSPYGNHGTITGAVWTRVPSGLWFLSFDGVDDLVECADADCLDITDNITVIVWLKRSGTNHRDIIIAKRGGGAGNVGYEFEITVDTGHVDQLQLGYQDNSGNWDDKQYSQSTIDTKWHQVASTRTPPKIRYFVDGKLDNENIPSYAMEVQNSHCLRIGAISGVAYLAGGMALLRIYNRVLSALEIQNAFNREKSLFGGW